MSTKRKWQTLGLSILAVAVLMLFMPSGAHADNSAFSGSAAINRLLGTAQTISALWSFTAGIITTTLSATVSATFGTAGTAGIVGLCGIDGTTCTNLTSASDGSYITASNPLECPTVSEQIGTTTKADYAPTGGASACTWLLTTNALNTAISGLAGGRANRRIRIENNNGTPNTISIVTGAGSTGNQGDFPTGSIVLQAHTGADFDYVGSAGTGVWRFVGASNTKTVTGGGTGDTTLTNHGVLLGQGTSAVVVTAAGAADTFLQGQGAADAAFSGALPSCGSANNALLYSTSTHLFTCSSTIPYIGNTISASVGPVTTNDTSDHSLMCIGVPAAAFLNQAIGKAIRITAHGDQDTGTGTPITNYKIKSWTDNVCSAGGVTMLTFGANTVAVTGLSNLSWFIDATFVTTTTGASGVLRGNGFSSVTFSNAANAQPKIPTSTNATVDLTPTTLYFSIVESNTSGGSATSAQRQYLMTALPIN